MKYLIILLLLLVSGCNNNSSFISTMDGWSQAQENELIKARKLQEKKDKIFRDNAAKINEIILYVTDEETGEVYSGDLSKYLIRNADVVCEALEPFRSDK